MFKNKYSNIYFKLNTYLVILTFIISLTNITPNAYAQTIASGITLPQPGTMLPLSAEYVPPFLKGMTINPEDPFQIDFIIDSGHSQLEGDALKPESTRLIKYFLTALTIPEEDLWVNLSPYEKNRIIPNEFGKTEMGRDLLALDYLLKQLTASLLYPEKDLGKEFWDRVHKRANDLYGSIEIPVNTFNKVWVVPEKAVVHEHENTVVVLESSLNVMLEEDYLATNKNLDNEQLGLDQLDKQDVDAISDVSSSIIRDVILPEIKKEINEGQTFAQLRQIYQSMILATWYKEKLKTSPLNILYSDQNKILGVDVDDKKFKQKIYEQYLEAFRVGVYDYIKEDYDPLSQEMIPKKYFSGGMRMGFFIPAGGNALSYAQAGLTLDNIGAIGNHWRAGANLGLSSGASNPTGNPTNIVDELFEQASRSLSGGNEQKALDLVREAIEVFALAERESWYLDSPFPESIGNLHKVKQLLERLGDKNPPQAQELLRTLSEQSIDVIDQEKLRASLSVFIFDQRIEIDLRRYVHHFLNSFEYFRGTTQYRQPDSPIMIDPQRAIDLRIMLGELIPNAIAEANGQLVDVDLLITDEGDITFQVTNVGGVPWEKLKEKVYWAADWGKLFRNPNGQLEIHRTSDPIAGYVQITPDDARRLTNEEIFFTDSLSGGKDYDAGQRGGTGSGTFTILRDATRLGGRVELQSEADSTRVSVIIPRDSLRLDWVMENERRANEQTLLTAEQTATLNKGLDQYLENNRKKLADIPRAASLTEAMAEFADESSTLEAESLMIVEEAEFDEVKAVQQSAEYSGIDFELSFYRIRGTNSWLLAKGTEGLGGDDRIRRIGIDYLTFDVHIHNHKQQNKATPSQTDLVFYNFSSTDNNIVYFIRTEEGLTQITIDTDIDYGNFDNLIIKSIEIIDEQLKAMGKRQDDYETRVTDPITGPLVEKEIQRFQDEGLISVEFISWNEFSEESFANTNIDFGKQLFSPNIRTAKNTMNLLFSMFDFLDIEFKKNLLQQIALYGSEELQFHVLENQFGLRTRNELYFEYMSFFTQSSSPLVRAFASLQDSQSAIDFVFPSSTIDSITNRADALISLIPSRTHKSTIGALLTVPIYYTFIFSHSISAEDIAIIGPELLEIYLTRITEAGLSRGGATDPLVEAANELRSRWGLDQDQTTQTPMFSDEENTAINQALEELLDEQRRFYEQRANRVSTLQEALAELTDEDSKLETGSMFLTEASLSEMIALLESDDFNKLDFEISLLRMRNSNTWLIIKGEYNEAGGEDYSTHPYFFDINIHNHPNENQEALPSPGDFNNYNARSNQRHTTFIIRSKTGLTKILLAEIRFRDIRNAIEDFVTTLFDKLEPLGFRRNQAIQPSDPKARPVIISELNKLKEQGIYDDEIAQWAEVTEDFFTPTNIDFNEQLRSPNDEAAKKAVDLFFAIFDRLDEKLQLSILSKISQYTSEAVQLDILYANLSSFNLKHPMRREAYLSAFDQSPHPIIRAYASLLKDDSREFNHEIPAKYEKMVKGVVQKVPKNYQNIIGSMIVSPLTTSLSFARGVTAKDVTEIGQEILEIYLTRLTEAGMSRGDASDPLIEAANELRSRWGLDDSLDSAGGTMGRWNYERVEFIEGDGFSKVILHGATRIPNKDGIVEDEFLVGGENSPRQITLTVRQPNKTEIGKGITFTDTNKWIIVRDEESVKHRIYGLADPGSGNIFLREDIFTEGSDQQIQTAIRHELEELTGKDHTQIRAEEDSENDAALRDLIYELSDKDKLETVGAAQSKLNKQPDLLKELKNAGSWITSAIEQTNGEEPVVIVVNGSPGSGKSTISRLIIKALQQNGYEFDGPVDEDGPLPRSTPSTVHFYDEEITSWMNIVGAWQTDFGNHKGIVVIETVNAKIPEDWENKDNVLLIHSTAQLATRVNRVISRGDQPIKAMTPSHYDQTDKIEVKHTIVIENELNITDVNNVGVENLSVGLNLENRTPNWDNTRPVNYSDLLEDNQVLVMNENHEDPTTRTEIANNLAEMKKAGVKYLALELDENFQSALDEFNATGKLNAELETMFEDMKDSDNEETTNAMRKMFEQAFQLKIPIIAIDISLQKFSMITRDILKRGKSAKKLITDYRSHYLGRKIADLTATGEKVVALVGLAHGTNDQIGGILSNKGISYTNPLVLSQNQNAPGNVIPGVQYTVRKAGRENDRFFGTFQDETDYKGLIYAGNDGKVNDDETTSNTEATEPQMNQNNSYGAFLRGMLSLPGVTQASVDRRSVLSDNGSVIENVIREQSRVPDANVAVAAIGSSLVGYARDTSDADYHAYFMTEEPGYGSMTPWVIDQFVNPGTDTSIGLTYAPNKQSDFRGILGDLEGPIGRFQTAQNIGQYLYYYFLPIQYGDPELVEQARRNIVAWLNTRNDGELIWNEVVAYIIEALKVDPSKVKRPGVREWLNDQGWNESRDDQLEAFNKERLKNLTPPTFAEITAIYQNPEFGGIDFNSKWLELQAQNSGQEIIFDIDPNDFQNLRIEGLTPIIFEMTPLPTLIPLLGLSEEEPLEQLSQR